MNKNQLAKYIIESSLTDVGIIWWFKYEPRENGSLEVRVDKRISNFTDINDILLGIEKAESDPHFKSWPLSYTETWPRIKDYFMTRTKLHISRVQKYADLVVNEFDEFEQLKDIVLDHDASKFVFPEFTPYVYATWRYKCVREGVEFEFDNEVLKPHIHEATVHHVKTNRHHPEYWTDQIEDIINKDNRDKPASLIDATNMERIFIAEMMCDWMAMSEENSSDPYSWVEKNVNVRWKFTDEQVKLIYEILDKVWKK